MMEYDSSMIDFCLTAMEAYITLICAEDAYNNIATEATVKKEPSFGSVLSTSVKFMVKKGIRTLRTTMSQILATWKRSILDFTNKVLIPIRLNKVTCRDSVNIYQFILMNDDRFVEIPKNLNKELDLLIRNKGDRSYESRYQDLELKSKMLGADCDRWISHSKSVDRQLTEMVKMMDITNNGLKNFISCEQTLKKIEISMEESDTEDAKESLVRVRWLIKIFSIAFATYNKILNQIVGSMSLTKSITNKIVNKITINKDADINLMKKN